MEYMMDTDDDNMGERRCPLLDFVTWLKKKQ